MAIIAILFSIYLPLLNSIIESVRSSPLSAKALPPVSSGKTLFTSCILESVYASKLSSVK